MLVSRWWFGSGKAVTTRKPLPARAPLWTWWRPAFTHSIGPPLGSLALSFIPYSAQVLVKSSKVC